MTGLRFLFRVTLRRLDLAAEIYHIREPQKVPLVMSPDETKRLLAVASSLKGRILLSLGYGCGLRAGEVVRLKVKHIDSAQKIIRIEQSKGRKDRNVMLSAETLDPMVEDAPITLRCGNAPGGTLAVSRQQAPQADDDPPAQPPFPRSGGRGRDQEGRDAARAAPQLRDPPAGARHRYQNHPSALGPRQIGYHGTLPARRFRHDRRRREPARSAVAIAQEVQEEQEAPAVGVTAGGHVPSSAGGCGYLPRPRGGVAQSQCRARQPRPDEGNVSHRALPHGGARWPRRALRGLRSHRHCLQQLS